MLLKNNIEIFANDFEYDIPKNIIIAKKNVIIENKLENYQIFADLVTYYRNSEKFVTKDDTSATIDSKYNFNSKIWCFRLCLGHCNFFWNHVAISFYKII